MSSRPLRRVRSVGTVVACALAVLAGSLVVGTGAVADPAPVAPQAVAAAPIAPVIDRNFADPEVLLVDGVYHAYATNSDGQNVVHATSRDLVTWNARPDVAPTLGAWVGDCSFEPGGATDRCVWAPQVTKVASGYTLYYTARDEASQKQCIGVSRANSPNGPFTPVGTKPLVCPTDLGGAIDASTYQENGQNWLLWKADGNCCSLPARIFIQPLSASGTTFTGPATALITNDQPWEGAVVEAPTLVKHGGKYYLFYSANDFAGGNYRTGYATATSPTGPFTKSTTELMTSDRFGDDVRGPGGQDVFTAKDGSTAIVFHGWDPTYSYRGMYVSTLTWTAKGPQVTAASTRYQAEAGVLTNARVVDDASASGGAKVGGMDFPDSSIQVRIRADKAGPTTLAIRYANGSTDADGHRVQSTDLLAVNDTAPQVVTFAHTTWGNWQLLERRVTLQAGWNTVTLTRGTYFAEIDAIDTASRPLDRSQAGVPAGAARGTRYEAEAGVLVDAHVRTDETASAGAVVGGLDNADSSVTVQIRATQAGKATLAITFSNGSERGGFGIRSTDTVTVNGNDAGVVSFPFTTWGNWTVVDHPVTLRKGLNTVTLTKSTFYAELDAIDLVGTGTATS